MEISAMVCGHYTSTGCKCPARRLAWWKPERWLLGPRPLCIFEDPELRSPFQRQEQAEPLTCPHMIPPEATP